MVKWNSDDENDSVYDDTTYKGNKNFVMKPFNDVSTYYARITLSCWIFICRTQRYQEFAFVLRYVNIHYEF